MAPIRAQKVYDGEIGSYDTGEIGSYDTIC